MVTRGAIPSFSHLGRAIDIASRHVSEIQSADLAGVLWAHARLLKMPPPRMLDHAGGALARADIRHSVTGLWALARLTCRPSGLCSHLLAEDRVRAMSTRDLSNVAWAAARLSGFNGARLSAAAAEEACRRRFKGFGGRHLAALCWAHATLPTHGPVLQATAAVAAPGNATLGVRELAALAWSCAPLSAGHLLLPLEEACAAQAIGEAPGMIRAAATSGTAAGTNAAVLPLLQLGWAFAFTGHVGPRFRAAAESTLRSLGSLLDGQHDPGIRGEGGAHCSSGPADEPIIKHRSSGLAVVHKPAHWEADTSPVEGAATSSSKAQRLSEFLQQRFGPSEAPVVHTPEFDFGLLHRLDTPSSGLLLLALNHEALLWARWQRDTLAIEREYIVLCHGYVPPDLHDISAPLASVGGGSRSEVRRVVDSHSVGSGGSRAARTRLKVLAHLSRVEATAQPASAGPPVGDAAPRFRLSLVAVRIVTGRMHQIRAHLLYVGHPVVCDGRYGQDTFEEDRLWCPRNFIHRWRLAFASGDWGSALGAPREVLAPLPCDLRSVLRRLAPRHSTSEGAVAPWLSDDPPASWGQLEVLEASD